MSMSSRTEAPWLTPQAAIGYCRTTYWVENHQEVQPSGVGLRLGVPCLELEPLLAQTGATAWAIVTSDNPYSQLRSPEENDLGRKRLAEDVADLGYPHLPTVAQAQDGDWPPERGFWIAGISREETLRLVRWYQQNAAVFGEAGRIPKLLCYHRCLPEWAFGQAIQQAHDPQLAEELIIATADMMSEICLSGQLSSLQDNPRWLLIATMLRLDNPTTLPNRTAEPTKAVQDALAEVREIIAWLGSQSDETGSTNPGPIGSVHRAAGHSPPSDFENLS